MAFFEQDLAAATSEGISLFTLSPSTIWEIVYCNLYIDPENDINFDVDSLFSTSGNIMASAMELIEKIVLHKRQGVDFYLINPLSSYNSTESALIKSFNLEISCKCPGEEIVFASRTLEILTKLSSYPFDQQVVLALAGFVLEYKETEQFAKLCAIFNQEPDPPAVKQPSELIRGDRVIELNKLIKATLQVIQHIVELENQSPTTNDTSSDLGCAFVETSFSVYWSIITLVACSTELSNLTAGDQDTTPYNLSKFSDRINFILNTLEERLKVRQQEKEAPSASRRLRFLYGNCPANIKDVFDCVVLFKDEAYPQQPIISVDSTTNEVFDINMLEEKCVLLYISTMDNINDTDVSKLREFDEQVGQTFKNCKTVWIPIVEDWSIPGIQEAFKEWRSKMPWYAVQYLSPAAMQLLKEWGGFEGEPIGLLMNEKGRVDNKQALQVIRSEGAHACFTFFVSGKDQRVIYHACAAVVAHQFYFKDVPYRKLFTNRGNPQEVSLKVLEGHNVLLLISKVDISPKVIDYFKPLHDHITIKKLDYKIVWMPIVHEDVVHDKKVLHMFTENRSKMPWLSMNTLAPIPGIKYIKDKWGWRGVPLMVKMDHQGHVDFYCEIQSNMKKLAFLNFLG